MTGRDMVVCVEDRKRSFDRSRSSDRSIFDRDYFWLLQSTHDQGPSIRTYHFPIRRQCCKPCIQHGRLLRRPGRFLTHMKLGQTGCNTVYGSDRCRDRETKRSRTHARKSSRSFLLEHHFHLWSQRTVVLIVLPVHISGRAFKHR